jgi:predicted nucleic acid-binding protein
VSYLLDTNVISEATKKYPDARLQDWLVAQPNESLFLSVITIGEIRHGLLLLDDGKKRRALLRWLGGKIKSLFAGRILPVDIAVMERWAQLQAASGKTGRRLPVMDSLIAATALTHNLTLATRNIADFKAARVALLDPWQ